MVSPTVAKISTDRHIDRPSRASVAPRLSAAVVVDVGGGGGGGPPRPDPGGGTLRPLGLRGGMPGGPPATAADCCMIGSCDRLCCSSLTTPKCWLAAELTMLLALLCLYRLLEVGGGGGGWPGPPPG